jgi:hypothetical protein
MVAHFNIVTAGDSQQRKYMSDTIDGNIQEVSCLSQTMGAIDPQIFQRVWIFVGTW